MLVHLLTEGAEWELGKIMSLVPGLKLYDLCQTPSISKREARLKDLGSGLCIPLHCAPGPDNTYHVTSNFGGP